MIRWGIIIQYTNDPQALPEFYHEWFAKPAHIWDW